MAQRCLFYYPPDGQARITCAWGNCEKVQAPRQFLNLCDLHARLAYRLLDQCRTEEPTETAAEYVAPIEEFAVRAMEIGWIYYLAVGEQIKVGYTADLKKRLNHYPPESELLAYRPGTKKDERVIHSILTAYRAAGREWYTRQPEMLEHIAAVIAEFGPAAVTHEWTKPATARTKPIGVKPGGAWKIA